MSSDREAQITDLLPLSPQVFHILVALAGGDQHGYAIMQDVAARFGLLAAGAIARGIASLLYGVHAFDPATFIAVPVLMLVAAAVACFVPAWKAARIDPIRALRQQ
jgi:hypothetical protein